MTAARAGAPGGRASRSLASFRRSARVVLLGTVARQPRLRSSSTSGCTPTETVLFIVSAAAILGLAWVVGLSTERLGSLTGPQVGGILNATFGNIAELIIAFFALQAGLIEVVKASLTGSIIGNLLLVLGASVLVGGLRHGTQTFSQRIAGSNAALLVAGGHRPVRAGGLRVHDERPGPGDRSTEESVLVAIVLIAGYVLSLDLPVHEPGRDARRPRRAGGPRGPGVDGAGRDRRAARRGRAARGPVGDPRRLDRAVHRRRSG